MLATAGRRPATGPVGGWCSRQPSWGPPRDAVGCSASAAVCPRGTTVLVLKDKTVSRTVEGLRGSQLIYLDCVAALPLTTPRLLTQVVCRRFAVRCTES